LLSAAAVNGYGSDGIFAAAVNNKDRRCTIGSIPPPPPSMTTIVNKAIVPADIDRRHSRQ
jgi:hypothetical protein